MKNLIIIGARGYGREIYHLALECSGYKKEYVVTGFLDDHYGALDSFEGYPPIIDTVEDYQPKENDVFICALGDLKAKIKYVELILNKDGSFISLIHPTAIIRSTSQLGMGCIVSSNVSISTEVEIGDFVSIQAQSIVGHDVKISNWAHLSPFVFLGGEVVLENKVQVYARATISPHRKVGENAIVGIGSIVLNDIEPNTTVFGNPAKKIRTEK